MRIQSYLFSDIDLIVEAEKESVNLIGYNRKLQREFLIAKNLPVEKAIKILMIYRNERRTQAAIASGDVVIYRNKPTPIVVKLWRKLKGTKDDEIDK